MIQKATPKEPSRTFFKLFTIIFIINASLSLLVYLISPEPVLSKPLPPGFEEYQSKTSILFPIVFQVMLLLMAALMYKVMPPILKLYPQFLKNFYMKCYGFFLGINPKGLDIDVLITEYISATILTMSAFLIPFNPVLLGVAFEIANLYTYLIVYLISVLTLFIPAFRFFSRKLPSFCEKIARAIPTTSKKEANLD